MRFNFLRTFASWGRSVRSDFRFASFGSNAFVSSIVLQLTSVLVTERRWCERMATRTRAKRTERTVRTLSTGPVLGSREDRASPIIFRAHTKRPTYPVLPARTTRALPSTLRPQLPKQFTPRPKRNTPEEKHSRRETHPKSRHMTPALDAPSNAARAQELMWRNRAGPRCTPPNQRETTTTTLRAPL